MKLQEEELMREMNIIKRENLYLKRKELRREREINQLMKQYEEALD